MMKLTVRQWQLLSQACELMETAAMENNDTSLALEWADMADDLEALREMEGEEK